MTPNKKKVRLKDIATDTGYSVSTVAKVMSGMAKEARIADETAGFIISAAKRLGYVPNLMARNLRSSRSGMIGIHLASANDAIIMETLTAILQDLPKKGYMPILTVEDSGPDRCHETWFRSELEGIIFCGPSQTLSAETTAMLSERNISAVIAGNPPGTNKTESLYDRLPVVQIDNVLGIQYAIDHLRSTGKRQIAHITGPKSHNDSLERMTAYMEIIKRHHNPIVADMKSSELFWQRGYQAASDLVARHNSIDAIIAYDDNVALGAMKFLSDSGMRIPEDIAVIGFDNQPQAEYSIPSLTTLDQPAALLGLKSLDILEKLIAGTYSSDMRVLIEPSLVVRESTICNKA